MKYYQYRNIVIKSYDISNYKTIVSQIRNKVDISYIMIEDIKEVDIDDYIEYLENSKIELQELLDNKSEIIKRLRKDLKEEDSFAF